MLPTNLLPEIINELKTPDWSSVDKISPIQGDLIEFERSGYRHWALSMSQDTIVHFNPESGEFDKNNALKFVPGKITIDNLKEVAGNSRTRINNKSNSNPNSFTEISDTVNLLLNNPRSKLYYNLSDFNCEHFVTFLKFGVAFSDQDKTARKVGTNLVGPSLLPIFGSALSNAVNDLSSIFRQRSCQKQWEENVRAARNKEEPKFLMQKIKQQTHIAKL